MSCVTMPPRAIVRTNIALRGLQFLSSLAAMALISASFQDTVFSPLLGSRSASFLMLMTYSTMLYAGWFLVCVELYPLVPRPRMLMMRALDGTGVVILLTSAIVMFNSEFVSQCGAWNGIIACKNLHASIFFSFASALLFVATIALTYVKNAPDLETTMEVSGYVIDSTPTNAVFSPCAARNAPPTPSAKV